MATFTKPSHRYATSDWFTSNYTMATNAERERKASHDTRQESVYLRNETDNRTKWDQLDTNLRLADRVDHLREMKMLLEKTLALLNREIGGLSDCKDDLECSLAEKNLRNHINIENLVLREGRQDIDVVEDEVDDNLHKERQLLCAIKLQLQAKVDEAFEHICLLQEIRCDTVEYLQNVNLSLDIDIDQYNLTEESAGVMYKPDPTRLPHGLLTVQQWEDFCLFNRTRANTEIANSVRLRECILANIQQANNDAHSQDTATQYALRRRCHEFAMALDELMWQKEQTEKEIAEQEAEISQLNLEIVRKKSMSLKLTHSRLENRTQRPNEELCRDNVQYGLTDELKQLEATMAALRDKLRQSQHSLDCLEANMHRLNCDIQFKRNSLSIDTQCIDSRVKLTPAHPLSITERNQVLVGGARTKTDTLAF